MLFTEYNCSSVSEWKTGNAALEAQLNTFLIPGRDDDILQRGINAAKSYIETGMPREARRYMRWVGIDT